MLGIMARTKEASTSKGKGKAPASKKQRIEASSSRENDEIIVPVLPKWKKNKPLSEYDLDLRTDLYNRKLSKIRDRAKLIIAERSTVLSDFEPYGFVECFDRLGWRAALTFNNDHNKEVYIDEIVEWMSTLTRDDGENPPMTTKLKGYVNKKPMVLSFATLDQIVKFDTGAVNPQRPYEYPEDNVLFSKKKDRNWQEMLIELFEDPPLNSEDDEEDEDSENDEGTKKKNDLPRNSLKPLAKFITNILCWNIIPKNSDKLSVRHYEVRILYALLTGKPTLSFRHLILANVWRSHESSERRIIPHCRLLSCLLKKARAIPSTAQPRMIMQREFSIRRLSSSEWTFTKGNYSYVLRDEKSQRTHEVARDDVEQPEGNDDEENIVNGDSNAACGSQGNQAIEGRSNAQQNQDVIFQGVYRPPGFAHWSKGEKAMYDRAIAHFKAVEKHNKRMEEIAISNIHARELEYNKRFAFEEKMRQYWDHYRGLPYTEHPDPVDFSTMPPHTEGTPQQHYPQSYHSEWVPVQSDVPPHSGEGSSQAPPTDSNEPRAIYMRVMGSLYGPQAGNR